MGNYVIGPGLYLLLIHNLYDGLGRLLFIHKSTRFFGDHRLETRSPGNTSHLNKSCNEFATEDTEHSECDASGVAYRS